MRSPCAISRKCAPLGGDELFRRAAAGNVSIGCFCEAKRRTFGTRAAILLDASNAQTSKAVEFERAIPRKELLLRQLVETASLLQRDPAATHSNDHRGLATDNPPLGVRMWQLLGEACPARRFSGGRFHEAPPSRARPSLAPAAPG